MRRPIAWVLAVASAIAGCGSSGSVEPAPADGGTAPVSHPLTGTPRALVEPRVTSALPRHALEVGAQVAPPPAAGPSAQPIAWLLLPKLTGSGSTDQRFGESVSISGDTIAVGAPGDNGSGTLSGSAYVFRRTGTTWQLEYQLNGAGSYAQFGASVSVDGDTLVVGAPGGSGSGRSGEAYVYTRSGTTWTQQWSVSGSGTDRFGAAVAVSGDTLVVGAPSEGFSFGYANIYVRSGSNWSQQSSKSAGSNRDFFGAAVALDGDVAVVGAPGSGNDWGYATIYQRSGTSWSTENTKSASSQGDRFGAAVGTDAATVIVGAPGPGTTWGNATLFFGTSSSWPEQGSFSSLTQGDFFGTAVGVLADTAAITWTGSGAGGDAGGVRVYSRSGSVWTQTDTLPPGDANAGDGFGRSVSVGETAIVVGCPQCGSVDDGAAYVFWRGLPLGSPCPAPADCASGYCVQGVCCDRACAASCESCSSAHTGAATGTCALVLAGTDPKNQCPAEAASTCGFTGNCSGTDPSCERHPASTVCAAASCPTATSQNPADLCDGFGFCSATPTTPCSTGYACVAGACRTTCTTGTDCATGYGCHTASGQCRLVNGSSCSSGTSCVSGFCVDGVCCSSACTGTCQACSAALKQTGASGTCGPAKSATDPRNHCADQGATSCGTNGLCNGAGACSLYPSGTGCGVGTCTGTVFNASSSCNGTGTCQPNATATECAPHQCAATGCRRPCTIAGDCVSGYACHVASGECRKVAGAACTVAIDCASDFCVDGVCCSTACTGACQVCSAALKASGTGSGTCGPAAAATDPHGDCADEGVSSCGTSGACDGAGACALYAAATPCTAGSCVTATSEDPPDQCSGTGTCAATAATPCATGYACVSGACRSTCTTDAHCSTGYRCHGASSACRKVDGATCAAASECASGFCVDGVCCATACSGTCQACSTATKQGGGTDGICGSARAGTDPHSTCADQGASSCGLDGSCDGAGACARYPSGTGCGAGSCSGTTFTSAGSCDGTGTCTPGATTTNCSPYQCATSGCTSPCSSDADCVSAHYCDVAGACVPLQPNASPCARDGECSSGACVDQVCCENACDAPCSACSALAKGQGDDGVCGTVASGLDPHDDCEPDPGFPASCKADGACDGSGACRAFARLGTGCGVTTCAGGLVQGDLCDGQGTCQGGSEVPCAPFGCRGNECGETCSGDAECAKDAICGPAGVCVATKPLGDSCGTDGECNSGYCVDGHCCNAICNGQCEACDDPSSLGRCGTITGPPHGSRAPCKGEGTPCAGQCDGADNSACTYPGGAQSCGEGRTCDQGDCVQTSPICVDEVTTQPPGGSPESCSPFACNAATGECRQTCAVTAECAAGFACDAPGCIEVGGDGASSTDDGGCGCRVGPVDPSARSAWLAGVIVLGALGRRRRRARRG